MTGVQTCALPISFARAGYNVAFTYNSQSGDIYFWGSDKAPYHEALATGNGNYIQAPQPGQNVQNGNINWYRPNYYVSMQNHQG